MLNKNVFYRPEIDGLRAIAVVAVIIYHFQNSLLPSGYLGVDIFFVISGYVITSSLVNNKDDSTLYGFIAGFYARRVKRIIPALFFCVVLTAILISFFNPMPDVSLKTGIASLFGMSNLYLLKQSVDYFGASSELNPFTHTWSLGVEEQFYFLFPFLVWLTKLPNKTSGSAIVFQYSIGLLCIASLMLFVYLNEYNQSAAYFIMPTRLWELGMGGFIYVVSERKSKLFFMLKLFNPTIVAGLLFLVLFIPTKYFVVATICAIFCTVTLIATLKKNTFVYSFFTTKWMMYIGLISYSLYLWHWSVLTISRWTIGVSLWTVPLQISIIILLAIFSYHFIEVPSRKFKPVRGNSIIFLLGAAVCVFAIGFLLVIWKYEKDLYLGNNNDSVNFANVKQTNINRENCHTVEPYASFSKCKLAIPGKQTIYFSGDSHTLHLHHAANYISKENLAGVQVYSVGATPFPNFPYTGWGYNEKQRDKYFDYQQARMSSILENIKNGDLIVLSSIWQDYLVKENFYSNQNQIQKISREQAIDSWKNKLIVFADAVKLKNVNIIMFLPLPRYASMKFGAAICQQQWFRVSSACSLKEVTEYRKPLEKQRVQAIKLLKEISSKRNNIFLFDPFSFICPATENKCGLMIDDYPIFYDNTHLTNKASEFIGLKLSEYLAREGLLH